MIEGIWRSQCTWSHHNKDDAILWYGDQGAAHSHEYLNNPNTNYLSTPSLLRSAPSLTEMSCDREENRSAYWMPSLILDLTPTDARLEPLQARIYYRRAAIDWATDIEPYHANHVMIAGDAHATEHQGVRKMSWSCMTDDGGEENFLSISAAVDDVPGANDTCPDDETYRGHLRLRVVFPNCWDGNTDFSEWGEEGVYDGSHMQYSWQEDEDRADCPTGWIPVPELTVLMRWDVENVDLTGAYLASDNHGMSPDDGVSGHADFMNGWDMEDYRGPR